MSALDDVVARMAEATSSFLQPDYLREGFAAVPTLALEALLHERRHNVCVEGWETYGVVHVDKTEDTPTTEKIEEPVEWPSAEISGGVLSITIQAYGDDPRGAFVKVVGPDTLSVAACFTRTANAVRSLLGAIWSGDPAVICFEAGDVRALRPVMDSLIEQHTLITVIDELVGTAHMGPFIDALVGLVGWPDLVTAVVTCKPRTPIDPEPF